MLVCGPPYSSVVQWSNEHHGVAEVVTSEEPDAMAGAVGRIARDPNHRWRLAEKAQQVGDRCFSASETRAVFLAALTATAANPVHA